MSIESRINELFNKLLNIKAEFSEQIQNTRDNIQLQIDEIQKHANNNAELHAKISQIRTDSTLNYKQLRDKYNAQLEEIQRQIKEIKTGVGIELEKNHFCWTFLILLIK